MSNSKDGQKLFGKRSGLKVNPVSIGGMRFPADKDKAISLIRQAIDAGMVYIDTSRGYGDSEIKIGAALKDGYRNKVILSTKCSPWIKKIEPDDEPTADCTYKRIFESMKRLDVEYLDFYQIWNIYKPEHFELAVKKGGMLDGIKRAIKEGLVRHTGFTTHDKPENIDKYIDRADWCEAILFTYNILDRSYEKVIEKAHKKGIATITMNPLGGGILTQKSPPVLAAIKAAIGAEDIIETAHRRLLTNENIDTILCGIAKPSDISSTLDNYKKGPFTNEQKNRLDSELEKISSKYAGFCVNCGYCLPCPVGINIPAFMNIAYLSEFLKTDKRAKELYGWLTNPNEEDASVDPSECIQCGRCEQRCTQHIKIIELLKTLKRKFG